MQESADIYYHPPVIDQTDVSYFHIVHSKIGEKTKNFGMAIMSFLESKDEVMAAVRFFSSLEFAEMRECFKSAQVN